MIRVTLTSLLFLGCAYSIIQVTEFDVEKNQISLLCTRANKSGRSV